MKTPCDDCIVYPTCAKTCIPLAHFKNDLDQLIEKHKKFIFSKNGHPRKHIKNQQRLHYNHLVDTWNRGAKQSDIINMRNFERFG